MWQIGEVSLGLCLERNSESVITGIFRTMFSSSSKETLKKRDFFLLNVEHWKKS